MGTPNPFTPFRDAPRPAKVLLFGEPGTEKTRRALLQTPGPRAYLDMEGSAAWYGGLAKEGDQILVTRRLRGNGGLLHALQYVEENPAAFSTVVIDPITMVWEQLQAGFRERLALSKQRKQAGITPEEVIIESGHWNALNVSHGDLLARLLSLPQHVVLIGRGKTIRDEQTGKVEGYDFEGWKKVPSLVSTVVETHPTFDVVLKDRSGRLTPGRVQGHVDISPLFLEGTEAMTIEGDGEAARADAGESGEPQRQQRNSSGRNQAAATKPGAKGGPDLAEARKVAIAHFTKIERLAQVEFLFGPSATWSQADLDALRTWSKQTPLPTFLESVRSHLEARGLMQEALEQFGPPDDPETAWVAADVATWIRQTHPAGGANG